MQTLLLPASRSGILTAAPAPSGAALPRSSHYHLPLLPRRPISSAFTPLSSFKPSPFPASLQIGSKKPFVSRVLSYPQTSPTFPPKNDATEQAKLAQVSKRLETTSRYFRRLGNLGFWGQLVCTVVAAVILSFSIVVTGKITSPFTFYSTAGGIAAAFISIFWSFGYLRIADKLKKSTNDPSKAPPRADVVKSLKNGIVLNLLGMGAAVLGMQATVGGLVAKALTSSASPYYQGIAPGSSPVLALDVFLVQASANTILSHFLGLAFSLELLRSVTLPSSEGTPVPRVA